MISTLTLALLQAKYKHKFEGLYIASIIFDIFACSFIADVITTLISK